MNKLKDVIGGTFLVLCLINSVYAIARLFCDLVDYFRSTPSTKY